MPRHLPVLVACVLVGSGLDAFAQSALRPSGAVRPLTASAAAGSVSGFVMDDSGQSVGGVSILAMGTVLAVAKSDSVGRFSLLLPAGEYVLRVAREGYVSTYREPVRVESNVVLERIIRIVRASMYDEQDSAALIDEASADEQTHGHSETAWILRHLGRTVLRNEAPGLEPWEDTASSEAFAPESLWDSPLQRSARSAASFLSGTDFTGELNFLTTSSRAVRGEWPGEWPRGLAYVAVGAPVAHRGDWLVRAAITGGGLSSWTLAADYRARADQTHLVELESSFSSQSSTLEPESTQAVLEPRSAGSLYASDEWRISRLLALEYGARLERYDYLAGPAFVSPEAGVGFSIMPRTRLWTRISDRSVAPGSDEFLPPSSPGPWLPPERTFSSLVAADALAPERVRTFSIAVEHALPGDGNRVITTSWFTQTAGDQLATLFGVDRSSVVGHYYVTSAGDVTTRGWQVELAGDLAEYVRGRIGYAAGVGQWGDGRESWALQRVAPSAHRTGAESLHDFTTALDVVVPETSTQVSLAYRLNSAFVSDRRRRAEPGVGGRFNFELRQALPYQPLRSGRLNVLFALRTLHRDINAVGSFYDELLTVKPPLRVTGGLQVGF
jgi:hypothetical protein